MKNDDIINAIKSYAKSYEKLELLQHDPENKGILPIGDQKTGVIGEFLAKKVLEKEYPSSEILLSTNHSQKGFDIKVYENKITKYFQVKTISEYSKTKRTSKIKYEFEIDGKIKKLDGIIIIFLEKETFLKGWYAIIKEDVGKFKDKTISIYNIEKNYTQKKFDYA